MVGMANGMNISVAVGNVVTSVPLADGSTAADLLASLHLLPDTHIFLRDNAPIPIDEPLKEGDSIKMIRVASGG